MNYKEQIRAIENEFFDVNSPNYADIELFYKIFKIFDIPDFKTQQPDIYEDELLRIRDLHNSFVTAYEKGYKQGIKNIEKIEGEIEVAKNALK